MSAPRGAPPGAPDPRGARGGGWSAGPGAGDGPSEPGHAPGAPLDPAEAARNRRIIRTVAVVFVAVSLFVLFWGLWVVQGTRERAAESDAALRSMAWAILCYADRHEGAFPTGATALEQVDTSGTLPDGVGWPRTQAAALEGKPGLSTQAAEALVDVVWPPRGDLPPVLVPRNGVSGFGTLELVNSWLREYAQFRAGNKAVAPDGAASASDAGSTLER
jgi:hypothetical protein